MRVRPSIKLEARCGRAGLDHGVVGHTGILTFWECCLELACKSGLGALSSPMLCARRQ